MTNKKKTQKNQVLTSKQPLKETGISYSTLIIILISFALGSIITLLVLKMLNIGTESFTVSELVSFLFGIALSAASTILAVVAISLGKASEQAMVDRSDESIRLQSDVFTKTIEVLQRIESSTGVTEKRIEDIISGRAGAISDKIAEKLIEDRGVKSKSKDAIRRDIQQSVYEGLSSQELEARKLRNEAYFKEEQERMERRTQAEQNYQKFHDDILLGISNSSKVKALKIGEGFFEEEGDKLFDGIFQVKDKRIAVSTFLTSNDLDGSFEDFDGFLNDIAKEITKNSYSKIFLAFDEQLTPKDGFYEALTNFRMLARKELSDNIVEFHGEAEKIVSDILEAIEKIE